MKKILIPESMPEFDEGITSMSEESKTKVDKLITLNTTYMTKFKDLVNLYIGCNVSIKEEQYKGGSLVLIGICDMGCQVEDTGIKITFYVNPEHVKPLLRPISDMTEEEMKEMYRLVFNRSFIGDNVTHRDIGKKEERWVLWSGVERLFIYKDGDVGADSNLHNYHVHAPSIVKYQLSKHFDLFGLIESGQAINITKQP